MTKAQRRPRASQAANSPVTVGIVKKEGEVLSSSFLSLAKPGRVIERGSRSSQFLLRLGGRKHITPIGSLKIS
jgi:hypothetical protein